MMNTMIDPRWFVVAVVLLAVAICGLWRRERNAYLHRRAEMNDSLTLAAQVGKPQAAGLKSSRIAVDRKAHVIQIARTKGRSQ